MIVVDEHADDPRFVNAISCMLSTQKYNVLAPIVRLNASALFIFRLKNMNEVNSLLEENSAS